MHRLGPSLDEFLDCAASLSIRKGSLGSIKVEHYRLADKGKECYGFTTRIYSILYTNVQQLRNRDFICDASIQISALPGIIAWKKNLQKALELSCKENPSKGVCGVSLHVH